MEHHNFRVNINFFRTGKPLNSSYRKCVISIPVFVERRKRIL
jgi:hypothetical protein